MKSPAANSNLASAWPHRLAAVLVCATFPLIWVGGLVTSQKAGMAVPDWPSTYGYNLFLYPWQTWLYGPWDLFIEHGHRLFAASVGLLTIVVAIVLWRSDRRAWLRWLAAFAVAAVIFQGSLGGFRVIQDKVLLAKIHGCIGPAFFALTVALAACTSRWWIGSPDAQPQAGAARLQRLALFTTALSYAQLVLGSQLRHLPEGIQPGEFRTAVVFHLVVAALVVLHVALLTLAVLRSQRGSLFVRPALGLAVLVLVQVFLGAGAWVSKYGWPAWLGAYHWANGYTVVAEGPLQVFTTTAHVATGSLILAVSLLIALRALRLLRAMPRAERASARPLVMEATR